jgi:beta-mannosidase
LNYRLPPVGGAFVFLLLAVLLSVFTGCKEKEMPAGFQSIQLNGGWRFRQPGEKDWRPAEVPGCVHTDLLNNGVIEDPFYRDNEKKLQWIEKTGWRYRCIFNADQGLLKKRHIEICFHGLDTYARVYLNGSPLLEADNMFRRWNADIKPLLKEGENILIIDFLSPVEHALPGWRALGYELPGGPRVMTRKAAYHFGWDWGPRLVAPGIWRPVVINAWDTARIDSLQIIQDDITRDRALLTAVFEIRCASRTDAVLTIEDLGRMKCLNRAAVRLVPGTNRVSFSFEIDNPRLWWTNGLGEPFLYRFEGRLTMDNRLIDRVHRKTGLRTVELVTEKDEKGESFYFKLNGRPLFIKGANYIPMDSFLNRVTEAKYRALVNAAADAHMNMLRVWGGGVYENDAFYDLCDEAGILVWQDFMFACAMYPGDAKFLENVRREAADNVKRLRHHACIALWCGNNEISEAWHNWGWQTPFNGNPELKARIWESYGRLFHEILPGVVAKYDSGRAYWPSSPKFGRGSRRGLYEGDSHYWGVWHDGEPFEKYKEKTGRFMSEYGFQSFPGLQTIKRFTEPGDRAVDSEVMKAHQKHPGGNELIRDYMARHYDIPAGFERFVYLSQLLQAEGMKLGIEAFRRAKPYCMGSLYWQLNDCWPAVSWSGIDYYGNPKALHYFVKRAYADVLISPVEEDGKLKVYLVSDRPRPEQGMVKLALMDFSGKQSWSKTLDCRIEAGASRCCLEIQTAGLLAGNDRREVVFSAEFWRDETIAAANLYYFAAPRELRLEDPGIETSVDKVPGGYRVTLHCRSLAKNVYLSVEGASGFFTDNFFDLPPGRPRTIDFITGETAADFQQRLRIISVALSPFLFK